MRGCSSLGWLAKSNISEVRTVLAIHCIIAARRIVVVQHTQRKEGVAQYLSCHTANTKMSIGSAFLSELS